MRNAISACLLAALLAAPTSAREVERQELAAITDEVAIPALEAFDALCGASKNAEEAGAIARSLDWQEFAPDAGSQQALLAAELTRIPAESFEHKLLVYRQDTSGLTLFALDVVSPRGEAVFECKINDETGDNPSEDDFVRWTGKQPTERKMNGSTEVYSWAPSHLPVPRVVASYFVPRGSSPRWPGEGLMVTSLHFYEAGSASQ